MKVFRLSLGQYFMWTAHDDLWDPTYISKTTELLEKNPSSILAVSEIDLIDKYGNKQGGFWNPFVSSTIGKSKFEKIIYSLESVYPHLIYGLFRSSALSEHIDFFLEEWPSPLGIGKDIIFLRRYLMDGDLVIVNEPLFYYRVGGESTQTFYKTLTFPEFRFKP